MEPKAEILKIQLIRGDWRVEDIIEHTDPSKTAIRYRLTCHMTAQVAAKIGKKALLYKASSKKPKPRWIIRVYTETPRITNQPSPKKSYLLRS